MAHYTHLKRRANQSVKTLNEESSRIYRVWEFPSASIWKFFVGTEEEYKHELVLIERRKNKKRKK